MILLDTNVISELIRPDPEPAVLHWIRTREPEIGTTVITVQELMFGVELLGDTERSRQLRSACEAVFDRLGPRILPLTTTSARYAAVAMAHRRAIGRPIASADAQIAGIALAHGASLATRNTRDFAGLPLDVVDPWRR